MPAFDFSGYSTKNYSSPTTTSNTGNSGRESGAATNRTQKVSAKAKAKVTRDIAKDNATAFNNYKYTTPKFVPSLLAKGLDALGISEKTFNANKSYYEKNLIGKINLATGKAYGASIEDYKSYMSARGSGEVDAMGRTISGGGDGGNTQPVITKNIGGRTVQTTAPTEAEVSQSEAANADAAALKVKKRGRSASIMTSSQGVTKMASNYSLGKKSLLGRV